MERVYSLVLEIVWEWEGEKEQWEREREGGEK